MIRVECCFMAFRAQGGANAGKRGLTYSFLVPFGEAEFLKTLEERTTGGHVKSTAMARPSLRPDRVSR